MFLIDKSEEMNPKNQGWYDWTWSFFSEPQESKNLQEEGKGEGEIEREKEEGEESSNSNKKRKVSSSSVDLSNSSQSSSNLMNSNSNSSMQVPKTQKKLIESLVTIHLPIMSITLTKGNIKESKF